MSTPVWKPGPTTCANDACQRNLAAINPTYRLQDKPNIAYCSAACRSTVTGERVMKLVEDDAGAPSPSSQPTPAPSAKAKTGKATPPPADSATPPASAKTTKTGKATPLPQPPAQAKAKVNTPPALPKAGRAPSPWANLDGKLTLTGKLAPNFTGKRKQVWELVKDGLTVRALYEQCDKLGLDGKSNLAKIIGVYGCAEVK